MTKKNMPAFRKGQLVMVVDDGTGPTLQPDFIEAIQGYTKRHGWSYYVAGCSHALAECQLRRIKKKEIR
jgi:hypothetical protein